MQKRERENQCGLLSYIYKEQWPKTEKVCCHYQKTRPTTKTKGVVSFF